MSQNLLLQTIKEHMNEGGLRTQGIFKQSKPNRPLITIITIVFNGKCKLEETIKTIIGQSYNNIEYIIVDGGSTDGTLDIIRQYEHCIDYWVSEKDGGIYDAMNKGIDLASGDWINFMNSGDTFHNEKILEKFFIREPAADILYGDTVFRYEANATKIKKPRSLEQFDAGLPFCHQSSFIRSSLLKRRKFLSSLRYYGDYELFYRHYKSGIAFCYVPEIISDYDCNGCSNEHGYVHFKELYWIRKKYLKYCKIKFLFRMTELMIRSIAKKILPRGLTRYIQILK